MLIGFKKEQSHQLRIKAIVALVGHLPLSLLSKAVTTSKPVIYTLSQNNKWLTAQPRTKAAKVATQLSPTNTLITSFSKKQSTTPTLGYKVIVASTRPQGL